MSKAIIEDTQMTGSSPRQPPGWETAPSVMREDDPGFARLIGVIGVCLVIVGGGLLGIAYYNNQATRFGTAWPSMALVLGLAAMLFHAAFDRDVQFRRAYMALGFAAPFLIGVFLCLVPYPEHMGDQFKAGFLFMSLALLFVLAVLRNETEPAGRQNLQYALGAIGLALSVIGLAGGCIKGPFMLPYGTLLSILGFCYAGSFVASRGVSDDRAYYAGIGLGAGGLLVFVIAVLRSLFPGETPGGFLIPYGVLLMALGFAAVVMSWLLCSEDKLAVVTRRELGAFFFSPIAYFVLFAFTCAAALNFFIFIGILQRSGRPAPEPVAGLFVFTWVTIFVVIFSVPVMTMRLFSEEKRTGTLEVMLTTPIEETTVVLGKFLAALMMYLLVWLPFALFLIALRILVDKPFDYRPLLAFIVGLTATSAGAISMGMFCSSLTRNQLVSGVMAFAGMMIFTATYVLKDMLVSRGDELSTAFQAVLEHLSYLDLWGSALQGKLVPAQLIFQGSLTLFFLFLTIKVLEARKWS
jgi:ABC-2 type transport system permease protein